MIDAEGTVHFDNRTIRVPNTVSPEARQYLATSPFGDTLPTFDGHVPAWKMRAELDAGLIALSEQARLAYPVDIEESKIAGIRIHWVKPLEVLSANREKVLINLHGGAFVIGSGSLIEAIPVANVGKIPVVAVDYRLAPEHPFPAAVDDSIAVYKELLKTYDPKNIGIYGTSAGGILTAQVTSRLIAEGLPMPAAVGMFTGTGDMGDFGDSAQIFSVAGFWGELAPPMEHASSELGAYRGKADPKDALMSPIYADLGKFPPSLLITGTRDAMLSAVCLFHRAIRRAGTEAELFVYEAMPHAHWYVFHLPESREVVDVISRFFDERLGK
ncbi:MAG: Monoterpene epsilon-lactone hydrolase [Rhodospirillales bacterium]|nr:Monoterpene epsilon-lactone hydrolase [Rhodospirillales bacterium]